MAVYTNFKNLTDAELELEEQRFNLSISNAELEDEAWAELSVLFEEKPSLKQDYYISYWRWFVILSWHKVYGLSSEMFIRLVNEQVPVAILAKFDVLNILLRYLAQNYYAREDLGAYFLKLKEAFVESDAIMGEWEGEKVAVKDLNSEYLLLQKRNASSIEKAEFTNKLTQIMFPKKFAQYIYVDSDEGIDIFLSLINFFKDIDNTNISAVLDTVLGVKSYQATGLSENPATPVQDKKEEPAPQNIANKYESMAQNLDAEIKASENGAVTPVVPAIKAGSEESAVVKLTPKEIPAVEVPAKPSVAPIPVAEAPAKLSATQIKSKIESEFKQDLDGNFVDIEGVMRKLEEFAETYNDPKIADMIYYDEEDDKFKWKV